MENNWGLLLCGRTEIPEERQEVATGEGISLVTVGSERYKYLRMATAVEWN